MNLFFGEFNIPRIDGLEMEKGRRVEEERRRGRTEEALKHSLAQAQVGKPSVATLGQFSSLAS